MSSRVYEAIVSRWSDQSLGDTFTGGLWFEIAPPGTDYPFVQMISLGNVPSQWTSTSEYREQSVQLSIFYEQVTSTDPVSAVGSLMRTLDDAMLFAPLSIPTSAGHVLEIRRGRDTIERDPEDRIWRGLIEYVVKRRAPVDYSPS